LEAGLRICINLIQIRIQHFRLNTDPGYGSRIWIQGVDDQKFKKKLQLEKIVFDKKILKTFFILIFLYHFKYKFSPGSGSRLAI